MLGFFRRPKKAWAADNHQSHNVATVQPVNHSRIPADPDRIAKDAGYAFSIAKSYVGQIRGGRIYLQGKRIVEFGPGINFGTAMILLSWGARHATVCDRFLTPFQSDYHIPLYRTIMDMVKSDDPTANTRSLVDCIEAQAHTSATLSCEVGALEELATKHPQEFDITLSNAVFEHLYHPLTALRSLHASMAPNAVGYHQVDFRDHRDFSRPLEYLLLDEFSFHALMEERHCECGNRVRPHEMQMMFDLAGFSQVHFEANMFAEQHYLDDFLPRLRQSRISPYFDLDSRYLDVISGRFEIVK